MEDIDSYHACIDLHLILFEPAGESAPDTVDGIFAACRNERASIVLKVLEMRQETEPNFPISRADEFVFELFEEPKRAEVLVSIFNTRARRR